MPTGNELVSNRPLSGNELRQIILKDVDSMLQKDGMMTPYIGYARVAYDVVIKLHLDNPLYQEHMMRVASKNPPTNIEENDPARAIQAPPIQNPTDEAAVVGLQRDRTINSPNHARLEHELPVTVTIANPHTGRMEDKGVTYDNSDLPGKGENVKDTNISDKVEQEWS